MRYFFGFTKDQVGQEGLSPVFTLFKTEADLDDLSPPEVQEVGAGLYYCDYEPENNLVFVLDGGAGDLDMRTIFGRFTPEDDGLALVRKLFWMLGCRLVINNRTGVFTAYREDGVTPAASGTLRDDGINTERGNPTWP